MAGKAYVVTSGKGGVGKTTITANLGCGLALRDKRVVLIDADTGLRNLDVVMGLENRIVYDLVHVVEGSCRLNQALIKDKRMKNLNLLPTAQIREKSSITPAQMEAVVNQLKEEFDYILVDCPAGIEEGFKNAIAGVDEALIVTNPEVSSVRDADRIIGLLEAAGIEEPKLIINRVRADMVKRGDMLGMDDILDVLAIDPIGIIPDDENIIVSTNRGEPIVLSGKGKCAQAFMNVVRRMEGEEVPFMNLDHPGFMDMIKRIVGIGQ
ncbi:MAG: septum site-determining protein MinD [Limnochordia bacterium]|jgi:septum site-determining protein MinD|nr:septum site-determining protein MinD [Limnochordia bacterium]MDD4517204.1 septum site-determining protein MinD [Limnochordia bacterium]